MIREELNLTGYYTFEAMDKRTGEILQKVVKKNVITQPFYDQLFSLLNYASETPLSNILNLNYFAVGDDDTAASRVDDALGNEILRKAPSTITYSDTILTAKTILDATEGNPAGGIIKEAGILINKPGIARIDGASGKRPLLFSVKNEALRHPFVPAGDKDEFGIHLQRMIPLFLEIGTNQWVLLLRFRLVVILMTPPNAVDRMRCGGYRNLLGLIR